MSDEATAETAELGGPPAPDYGTRDEIREALGFNEIEDLPPDTNPRPDKIDDGETDEVAAKRDEKGKFTKADRPEAKKEDAEDDDVATIKQIEGRAKARRAASRNAAAAREAAKPAPVAATAPVAAAKPEAAPGRTPTAVESAVSDVLAQIAKLAGDDATAVKDGDGAAAPDTAARKAQLDAITAKLDEIRDGALKTTEEGAKNLAELEGKFRSIEVDRIIRSHITKAIDPVIDDLPLLSDAKAIREFNRKNGTTYADAVEMIADAAGRFNEKFKAPPDFKKLAQRIERKLSGKGPETSAEKPTSKSTKTVSRSDASPPSARTGPDTRTAEEAEADFKRAVGLD